MEAHPPIQCVEDHWDADKVVGRVGGQVFPELANVGVHLPIPAISQALGFSGAHRKAGGHASEKSVENFLFNLKGVLTWVHAREKR